MAIERQRSFFGMYVQPFLTKGQKVFVIISDALRYEAARDFAQRLQAANRWTAEVEALFGITSYLHSTRNGLTVTGRAMDDRC